MPKRSLVALGFVVLFVSGCLETGAVGTVSSDTPSSGSDAFASFASTGYQSPLRRIEFVKCSATQLRDIFPENHILAPRPLSIGKSDLTALFAEANGALECAMIGRKSGDLGEIVDYLVRPESRMAGGRYLTTMHLTFSQRNSDISGQPVEVFSTTAAFGRTRGALDFAGSDAEKAMACKAWPSLCQSQGWDNNAWDYVVDVEGRGPTAVNLSKSNLASLSFK